jgi:hypothetical protein
MYLEAVAFFKLFRLGAGYQPKEGIFSLSCFGMFLEGGIFYLTFVIFCKIPLTFFWTCH